MAHNKVKELRSVLQDNEPVSYTHLDVYKRQGCETAEEQRDDEVRTSQVPERSEGKTKAISNSTYRLWYALKGARRQRSEEMCIRDRPLVAPLYSILQGSTVMVVPAVVQEILVPFIMASVQR